MENGGERAERHSAGSGAGGLGIIGAFAPWIIFWVIAGPSTWEWAVLAAAVAALGLSARDILHRRLKVLDGATLAFFVALTIVSAAVDRETLDWLERWANTISSGVLAAIGFGSLAIGVPFTLQYAKESAPREVWDSPLFKRINVVITLVWSLIFLATALLGIVAVERPSTQDWTQWVIPIVLVVWGIKFTAHYPDVAAERAGVRRA
jgi:uncharacterized membrane protein